VASFTPLSLYPRRKRPRYPLDRMLGGPQSRCGQRGEEKILDSSVVQPVASYYTDYVRSYYAIKSVTITRTVKDSNTFYKMHTRTDRRAI
jgi:hypothetical protein